MIKTNRLALAAILTALGLISVSPATFAEDEAQSAQAICAQQAEEDGFSGEDKVAAIKQCMEDQAAGGGAAQN